MNSDQEISLPIFPLENVVLFPTVSVPLFIFEPRYRQMTQNALNGDRKIGMVTAIPKANLDMGGEPDVFDIGCEGYITSAEQQEDGTFKLLLTGTQRFRIVSETAPEADRLYREARILPLREEPSDERSDDLATLRQTLNELLHQFVLAGSSITEAEAREVRESIGRLDQLDDHCFGQLISQQVNFGVLEKQRLLETNNNLDRYGMLELLLRFQIALLDTPTPVAGSNLPQ
ncbi:MAG: LON peptidase substrate-binding domain-containing protein [Myxococcota bacterium]|nr:LON peptidase substrate-binding domain-containing protein [Myxococcota bacterium]